MTKYLNKLTKEIVTAFELTSNDIEAIKLAGGDCTAREGDFLIVRPEGSRECSKRIFMEIFSEIID